MQSPLTKTKLSKLAKSIPPDDIETELFRRQVIYTRRIVTALARLTNVLWYMLATLWLLVATLERFRLNPDHSLRRRSSWHIPAG
jgi:hypothetical protein